MVGGPGTPGYMLPPPSGGSEPYFFTGPDPTSAESLDPVWCVRFDV